MYLKPEISIFEFLKTVDRCEGDVYLYTVEEDNLNLKSSLSRYIFAVTAANNKSVNSAEIRCDLEGDFIILKDFLTEKTEKSKAGVHGAC